MNVLLTGASGFVGGGLMSTLIADKDICLSVVLRSCVNCSEFSGIHVVQGLSAGSDWSAAVLKQDAVIHAAARVHVMKDQMSNPLAGYRCVNVDGTLQLAKQAAAAGVKRFIFISSVKVNGEATLPGIPFSAEDAPAPLDPYGVSKLEAEQGLREISAQTGMEVVIVRPPLVYGPGVKANFASMMLWVARGVPLPLGSIRNSRSMVALDNLVDLLVTCLKHPAAAGQTFLVSDGEDVSTTQLLRRTAQAMGKPSRLLPVPVDLLQWGAALAGKRDVAQRLCGSLQVDISKTRQLLGWSPPLTLDQGLKKAVEGLKL